MFCPKCGTQNPDGATFCKECGNSLGAKPAASTAASSTTSTTSTGSTTAQRMTAKAVKSPSVASTASSVLSEGAAAISKKGINPKIVGIVVVVVLALLIIFGITQCVGGGGPLRDGTYSAKPDGSSSTYTAKVEGNKISVKMFSRDLVLSFDKAGNKGDSILYNLKIVSADGKEVKYDKDGYITNGSETLGSGDELMKLNIQLLMPKGGLDGKPVGTWGFLATQQRASSNAVYVRMFDVKEGGDMIAYSVNSTPSNASDFPELTLESVMAANGSKTYDDCSYTKLTDTAYKVDIDGSEMNVTYTK